MIDLSYIFVCDNDSLSLGLALEILLDIFHAHNVMLVVHCGMDRWCLSAHRDHWLYSKFDSARKKQFGVLALRSRNYLLEDLMKRDPMGLVRTGYIPTSPTVWGLGTPARMVGYLLGCCRSGQDGG
jgi:hypothetical protein